LTDTLNFRTIGYFFDKSNKRSIKLKTAVTWSKSNLNMMNIYEESTLNFWIWSDSVYRRRTDNTMAKRKLNHIDHLSEQMYLLRFFTWCTSMYKSTCYISIPNISININYPSWGICIALGYSTSWKLIVDLLWVVCIMPRRHAFPECSSFTHEPTSSINCQIRRWKSR
jgi:hypothetical protein